MEINTANVEKEEEMLNLNTVGNRVLQNCQCNELKERSKKAEVRCAELEIELQNEKDRCGALEAKVKVLEREKFALENEVRVLKMASEGLNRPEDVTSEKERAIKPIVDLEKHNDAVPSDIGRGNCYDEENGKKQENKQISADTSSEFQQNQENITDLRNADSCISPSKEIGDMQLEGTPSNGIFHRSSMVLPLRKGTKHLSFETEESPSKKMIQSLPISTRDSDDESTQDPIPVGTSTSFAAEKGKSSHSSCAQNNEENLDFSEELLFVSNNKRKRTCNVVISESESDDDDNMPISQLKRKHMQEASADQVRPDLNSSLPAAISEDDESTDNVKIRRELLFVVNTKRKRTSNVVTSESESDDDDNMPISKLKRKHMQEVSADQVRPDLNSSLSAAVLEDFTDNVKIRRRLQPLRKCLSKSHDDKMSSHRPHSAKHQKSVPANNDQSVEDLSLSEGESMSSFIVDDDDSDVSDTEDSFSKSPRDGSNSDVDSASSNLQDVSDGEMNLGEILSKIQRSKKNEMKWEYEGDMLAAFGKDKELCMKAVCSLYQQQIFKEKMWKENMYQTHRGFSRFHAPRGSALGEFLTDGDPDGGLKKSVEELEEYDPEAVELCRTLATNYSKQLYEIYKNKEDPFFP